MGNHANYVEMDGFSLFRDAYAYVDSAAHSADQVFVRHELRVDFCGDFVKDGEEYQLVVCKVSKKRRDDFAACMAELSRNMLVLGHVDYAEACGRILGMLG